MKGDVTVQAGASLSTTGAWLGDDLLCAGTCDLTPKTVAVDSVDVQPGGAFSADAGVFCNDTIGGDLVFALNQMSFDTSCGGSAVHGSIALLGDGGTIAAVGNRVGNDLALVGNRASAITVDANTVGDAIVCRSDSPQPVGAGNTARRIDPACGPIGVATGP